MPNSYVICHLDGKKFSNSIKDKFELPFSDDFMDIMNETAVYLCNNVQGCIFSYVQSDEITLILTDFNEEGTASGFFGYRLCKIQSVCASMASGKFNKLMTLYEIVHNPDKDVKEIIQEAPLYDFDCKAWSVPFYSDAFSWILYRQIDCVKNSKQQAAQTYCTYDELLHKTANEQIEFLKEKQGIDWNTEYDEMKKFGRFLVSAVMKRKGVHEGKEVEYTRNVWCIFPGKDLTDEKNRQDFLDNMFPNTRIKKTVPDDNNKESGRLNKFV